MFPPLYAHLSWDRTGMGKCNPARKKIEKYMIGLGHTWLQIRRCVTRFPWKYVHNTCNWRREGERAMQREQRAREHGGTRPSVWSSAPAVLSFSANSFAASCQRICVHVWCWRYVGIQTVYTCVCRQTILTNEKMLPRSNNGRVLSHSQPQCAMARYSAAQEWRNRTPNSTNFYVF